MSVLARNDNSISPPIEAGTQAGTEGSFRARFTSRTIDWAEPLIAIALITALVFTVVRTITEFWLPLDAAHFSAEADWLRGNREILLGIHPPIFPSLIVAVETFVDRWNAVLIAMSLSYACYVVAVFGLLRRWHDRPVAWLGAAAAAANPVLAEIIGWGGGANLLGFAALIAALSATERWIQSGKGAIVVGVLIGVAGASHPLAGLLAVAVIALRLALAWPPARPGQYQSYGIRSVRGWALLVCGGVPFAVLSASYYLGVESPAQTSLGFPDLRVTLELLNWSGREHLVLFLINVSALVLPFFLKNRASRPVAMSIAICIILTTSMVKGDVSYQSRVIYLLPVLVGLAFAELAPPAARYIGERFSSRPTPSKIIAALVAVAAIAQIGFLVRLDAAVDFYQRIERSDAAVMEQMSEGEGSIASSHWSRSTAEPTNWLVSASSRRPAISPMGPWLSTDPTELAAALDMQKFFAGQIGVEDGVFQIAAAGTDDGYYSLQIAIREEDWYHAAITLDAARSRLPFPIVKAEAKLVGDSVVLVLSGPDDEVDTVTVSAMIEERAVSITAKPDPNLEGDWHVVFNTSPGASWSPILQDSSSADFVLGVGGDTHDASISLETDVPARATIYGTGLPIDFDFVDPSEATWTIDVDTRSVQASKVSTFTESDLIAEHELTSVIVWQNTTLAPRFRTDCFRNAANGDSIVVFDVMDDEDCPR